MNRKSLAIVILIGFPLVAHSQDMAGVYNKNLDKKGLEKIILKKDGTFIYTYMGPFYRITEAGNWRVVEENLILNSEKNISQRFKVDLYKSKIMNKYDLGIIISVSSKNIEQFNYDLISIKNNDTTYYEDKIGSFLLPESKIEEIGVINSVGFQYPTIKIVKGQNIILIKLTSGIERIFYNEKWRIINGSIKPKNIEGNDVDYILKKVAG